MNVLETLAHALGFIGNMISQAIRSVSGLTNFYYQRSWGRIGENAPPPAANNFSMAEFLFASLLALPLSLGLGWISPFLGSTFSRFGNAVSQTWRLENPQTPVGEDLTFGQHVAGVLGNLGYVLGGVGISIALTVRTFVNFFDAFRVTGAWALKKSLPSENEVDGDAAYQALDAEPAQEASALH